MEKYKQPYKNNKFKISAPTWTKELKLPNGSYSVSNFQDHFEYIIKKHQKATDNPPVRIYVTQIENRKTGYYLKL